MWVKWRSVLKEQTHFWYILTYIPGHLPTCTCIRTNVPCTHAHVHLLLHSIDCAYYSYNLPLVSCQYQCAYFLHYMDCQQAARQVLCSVYKRSFRREYDKACHKCITERRLLVQVLHSAPPVNNGLGLKDGWLSTSV